MSNYDPIADKLAAIAQGDTYDEAALRRARDLLVSIRRRADHGVAEIDQLMRGGGGDVGDAAVLLAAVEPLYAKRDDRARFMAACGVTP